MIIHDVQARAACGPCGPYVPTQENKKGPPKPTDQPTAPQITTTTTTKTARMSTFLSSPSDVLRNVFKVCGGSCLHRPQRHKNTHANAPTDTGTHPHPIPKQKQVNNLKRKYQRDGIEEPEEVINLIAKDLNMSVAKTTLVRGCFFSLFSMWVYWYVCARFAAHPPTNTHPTNRPPNPKHPTPQNRSNAPPAPRSTQRRRWGTTWTTTAAGWRRRGRWSRRRKNTCRPFRCVCRWGLCSVGMLVGLLVGFVSVGFDGRFYHQEEGDAAASIHTDPSDRPQSQASTHPHTTTKNTTR